MELFTATILTLGIGLCDPANDYCPEPVGKVSIEQELVRVENHVISLEMEHYSQVGNGEPISGDRGTEFLMLEYKHTFNWR